MTEQTYTLETLASDTSEGNASAVVRENARLYLDNQDLKQRLKRHFLLVSILILALLFQSFAFFKWYPIYRYVQTKDNSVICEINTQDSPNITSATLTEYAKDATVHAYTFDYINWRQAINETANKFFSNNGYKAYMHTLDESKNLEQVRKNRLVLRAMGERVPQLEEEGFNGVTRFWTVLVPIAIEFYSGGKAQPDSKLKFIAHVTVIKTKANYKNRDGIEVDSIVLKPDVSKV